MPKDWTWLDINDGFKLGFFLARRFLYIIFKAKVESILTRIKRSIRGIDVDSANPEQVAEAMERAAVKYNKRVEPNKNVKRGIYKIPVNK